MRSASRRSLRITDTSRDELSMFIVVFQRNPVQTFEPLNKCRSRELAVHQDRSHSAHPRPQIAIALDVHAEASECGGVGVAQKAGHTVLDHLRGPTRGRGHDGLAEALPLDQCVRHTLDFGCGKQHVHHGQPGLDGCCPARQ